MCCSCSITSGPYANTGAAGWNFTSNSWFSLGGTLNQAGAYAIVADPSDDSFFIGGNFLASGSVTRAVTRWSPSAGYTAMGASGCQGGDGFAFDFGFTRNSVTYTVVGGT